MRACASDPEAARLCGISTRNMVTLSFMLSAGIGAMAGCVISPLTQTQYDCGTGFAVKGFTAAIVGGLGSSVGAVLGGILIGLLESFSIHFLPLAFKDVVAIAILLALLFLRPSGLFGNREASSLRDF
jgi:branched-chain amino acid transport system permease protein